MEENQFNTLNYLFSCVLIFQLMYSTHSQFHTDANQSDSLERMTSIREDNRLDHYIQEREMYTLKNEFG